MSDQQSLFALQDDAGVLYFDGGSRGNPGLAAYGYVIERPEGEALASEGHVLGVDLTNNVAEYGGVIAGMQRALELGVTRLRVYGDSKLVIEQLKGKWRVRAEGLKALHQEAQALARRFESVTFEHVRRERNAEADRLANVAMDEFDGRR
jgi:ribonuclease H / adenosylcobalamin/alpha-ribazole phosphatase